MYSRFQNSRTFHNLALFIFPVRAPMDKADHNYSFFVYSGQVFLVCSDAQHKKVCWPRGPIKSVKQMSVYIKGCELLHKEHLSAQLFVFHTNTRDHFATGQFWFVKRLKISSRSAGVSYKKKKRLTPRHDVHIMYLNTKYQRPSMKCDTSKEYKE